LTEKTTNTSKTSDAAPEPPEDASVFDFLYADTARIASIISQFNDFGNLTDIIHSKTAERSKSDRGTVGVEGGAIIAKGNGSLEKGTQSAVSENNQKSYDPRWVNTLTFLDEIQSRGMLKRDISTASFGDLVLVEGPLNIRDLGTLEKMWDIPMFQHLAEAASGTSPTLSRQEKRRNSAKGVKAVSKEPTQVDFFFDLVKVLPHTTQLTIGTSEVAWGILKSDGLTSSPSDFALRFGGVIPGNWAAVGILDARPDDLDPSSGGEEVEDPNDILKTFISQIEPVIRAMLGRSSSSYGITPLAVFREIG
jgi:hypothetical protein